MYVRVRYAKHDNGEQKPSELLSEMFGPEMAIGAIRDLIDPNHCGKDGSRVVDVTIAPNGEPKWSDEDATFTGIRLKVQTDSDPAETVENFVSRHIAELESRARELRRALSPSESMSAHKIGVIRAMTVAEYQAQNEYRL